MNLSFNFYIIGLAVGLASLVNSAPSQMLSTGASASALTNGSDQLTKRGEIGYPALKTNTAPCSLKHHTQGNCHPGAEANPPTRGCNGIYRCRKVNQ